MGGGKGKSLVPRSLWSIPWCRASKMQVFVHFYCSINIIKHPVVMGRCVPSCSSIAYTVLDNCLGLKAIVLRVYFCAWQVASLKSFFPTHLGGCALFCRKTSGGRSKSKKKVKVAIPQCRGKRSPAFKMLILYKIIQYTCIQYKLC